MQPERTVTQRCARAIANKNIIFTNLSAVNLLAAVERTWNH